MSAAVSKILLLCLGEKQPCPFGKNNTKTNLRHEKKKMRGFIFKITSNLSFCHFALSTILAASNTDVVDRT